MKLAASLALLAVAATTPHLLLSQQPAAKPAPFTDPANLAGERVTPLNGHELPIDRGALGLAELLRKLNTRASILNIVAHPDDEDGGMLTLYARGLGARVADLALTRGEGGQNFVTGDFEDALGLIRTQELLANDRYTGVTQMFGTEVDFGFSKTREESFQKWGHQRVLYDVVRAIRITRPLVITATFIGNVTDGHGQHQVSGEIAQEAFKAAADPNVFPELTAEGILPWQALKVYARVPFASIDSKGVYDYATNEYVPARFTNYVTGTVTTAKPTADITVPEGDTDPLLTAAAANPNDIPATLSANPTEPLSYMQFGRIGLGLQRTQISKDMRLPTSGAHNSGYTLYGSVLCNAPANARDPNITYNPTSETTTHAATPDTFKNCHPEQVHSATAAALKGRGFSPAVTNANLNRALAPEGIQPSPQIPSSRPDPELAEGAVERPRYLNAAYTPTTPPAPSQTLATTSSANGAPYTSLGRTELPIGRSALDGASSPREDSPEKTQGLKARLITASDATHPPDLTPSPSSRPDPELAEGAVGRPLYLNAATTPTDLTTNPTFFTGIDTSIEAIATLAPNAPPTLRTQLATIATNIAKATQDFNPNNPSAIAPPLAEALQTDDALINQLSKAHLDPIQKENVLHELRIKRVQLNDALTLALGLHLDATAASSDFVENSTPEAKTQFTEDTPAPVAYNKVDICADACERGQSFFDSITPQISSAHPLEHDWHILAQNTTPITQPYFYRDNIEQPVYKLRDPALRSAPQTPAPLTAWATVTYQGTDITLARIVHAGSQPISIIPPVSIASAPSNVVLPNGQPAAQLTATLTTEAHTSANINVESPKGWSIQAKAASASSVNFILHPPATFTDPAIFHLTATTPDHHAYTEGWRPVGYPGLILTNDYTPATTRVVPVDLKLPEHDRIAYLPGTGDAVPEALASIGLTPTLITVADLTPSKLSSFDTVVLGVRTYSAHPDLQGAPTKALLDFARNGGNVVVQYQTSDFTSADAPYPLDLGPGAKVVVETDPVELSNGVAVGAEKSAGASPSNGVAAGAEKSVGASPSNAVAAGAEKSAGASPSNGVAAGAEKSVGASPSNGVAAGFSPRSNGHGKSGALAPAPTNHDNSASATKGYPGPSGSGLIAKAEKGVLTPGYALLNIPNKITPADFNNWIEERGHGFLETWDPHYTALTETHDPGGDGTLPQAPQHGGLLTAPVGKGRWTYVAFALYRQLPQAVPGAFRIFVNLVTPPTR